MDFAFTPKVAELRGRLLDFMDSHVLPAEHVYADQVAAAGSPYSHAPIIEELKVEARTRGLWNLFLPSEKWGAGLTNLEYAPLAEISGRSPAIAPESINCSAPDTGNMELLAEFGTPMQQEQWLGASPRRGDPLLLWNDRARCGQLGRDEHPQPHRP